MTSTSENTIIPFTSPSKKPSQPQHKSSNLKLTRPSLSTLTSSLSRTKSSIASPIHHHHTTSSSNQITTPIPTHSSSSTSSFSIGDRVKSTNQIIGKCAYIGTIHQKTGIWVGIDLSYPLHDLGQPAWYGKGKNSGSVNGVSYFDCDPNCGIFFPISKVSAYPFQQSTSTQSQSTQSTQSQSRIIFPPRPLSPTKPSTINSVSIESDPSNPPSSPKRLSRSLKASLPNQSANHLSTPKPRPRISLHHNARKSIGNLFHNNRPTSTAILPSTNTSSTSINTPNTPHLTSSKMLRNFSSKNSTLNLNVPDLALSSNHTTHHSRTSLPDHPSSDLHVIESAEKSTTEPILLISDLELNLNSTSQEKSIEELKSNSIECIKEDEHSIKSNDPTFQMVSKRLKEIEEELRLVKDERDELKESLRLTKESSSLNDETQSNKINELELENQKQMKENLKEIEEMKEKEREMKEELNQSKSKFEEEKRIWKEEKEELIEQLGSLRIAGQSLCSVYEEKISEVEERRVEAIERLESLMKEGQGGKTVDDQNQLRIEERSRIERSDGHQSMEAIEIDNERLKADLKYTKDRLNTLQDQVYELKQELESEIENKEKTEEELRKTIERHKTMVRKMKEENLMKHKEKEALELRLGQVEMRLKECVETMEKDRAELEGLRDELMVSQPRSNPNTKLVIPTNTDDDDGDRRRTLMNKSEVTSNEIVNDRSGDPHQESDSKEVNLSTYTKDQLEVELSIAKRRIEELSEQLDKAQETPKLERMNSNEKLKSIREDEEKLEMMSKYQGLLSAVQEENLGLIKRLERLESHLSNLSSQNEDQPLNPSLKSKPKGFKKQRHREEGEGSFGSSVGSALPQWVTDQRSNGSSSGGSITKGRIGPSNGMMSKEMQEILGLKVLLNQSDEDRVKVEVENRELKEEIEELKNTNRMLEGAVKDPTKMIKDYDKTIRLEKEITNLKHQLDGLNRKHIQQVDALNQEVVELESIIELKVLKEAELEAELNQFKFH